MKRLLLVDDDDLVRISLARSLRRWWRVVAVASGAEALAAIEREANRRREENRPAPLPAE